MTCPATIAEALAALALAAEPLAAEPLVADPALAGPAGAPGGDEARFTTGGRGVVGTVGDAIAVALILLGVGFSAISAVGVVRMPDVYTRMQAAAKAGTLGLACLVAAAAAHYAGSAQGWTVFVEVALILVFVFLTTPASAHLIAKAAYTTKIRMWQQTAYDELSGCYHEQTHELASEPAAAEKGTPGRDDQDPDDPSLRLATG